ncbi:hypothetical protein FKL50_27500, partial [Klebsiella pneumoniae]|nr:hypothetical protein [Klebsiella pneumoniae]
PTRGEIAHLVIDSTGLKVFGEGEWKVGFEGQWNENVRLWYNLLIIIQYTKVPFQGPFRML